MPERVNKGMPKVLLLCFLLIIAGCGKNEQTSGSPSPGKKDSINNNSASIEDNKFSFAIKPGDNSDSFKIKLEGEISGENIFQVEKILLFKEDSLTKSFNDIHSQLPLGTDLEFVVIEDMNFDGYYDFRLIEFIPAAPNIPYLYFFYDPVEKGFYRDTAFERITSPIFDQEKKQISSSWRGSPVTYGIDFYEVRNNKPFLFKQVIDEKNEEGIMVRKTYLDKNGVMELAGEEAIRRYRVKQKLKTHPGVPEPGRVKSYFSSIIRFVSENFSVLSL
jgi:hypothetical protein